MKLANDGKAPVSASVRNWLLFRSFAGWRISDLAPDFIAGLTVAAIAVPEQMATARLAGFGPETGFLALAAGAIGFAVFGANRVMSVGADSTIAPIFAGALAAIAASGSPEYAADAAALAIGVGVVLIVAGLFRLEFIADLLSIPVTTGFLAGIAVHIVISQAPALIGVGPPPGSMIDKLGALAGALPHANLWTLGVGFGVYALMEMGERLSPRAPTALIALALATLLTVGLGLEARGAATLGALPAVVPHFALPAISFETFRAVAPLALIVAVVAMVQTAATARSFDSKTARDPDIARDFVGVGAANIFAGFTGVFPVNASPPRSAIVAAAGGVSQLSALLSAALALIVSIYGGAAIGHVPYAALAGLLLFVARRITRTADIADVWKRSSAEFALILCTVAAIVVLPIEQGVGVGVILSILHGVWTTTRAGVVEFKQIPGTSIWWPDRAPKIDDKVASIRVVGLQAPLSFLNAYGFGKSLEALSHSGVKLLVIESTALVEIDYTGAKVLAHALEQLRAANVDVAFARLESLRAQQSFQRHGLEALVGRNHVFHSVAEAIDALRPTRDG